MSVPLSRSSAHDPRRAVPSVRHGAGVRPGRRRIRPVIGYSRRSATARTGLPCPLSARRLPRSFDLVQPTGPRDGDAIARDRARLARVADGDQAAFAAIVGEETPRLVRFVATILGAGSAEADEIVQEAMLRLWRQADTWQPDGRISAWLHRVAYRLAIDTLRRRRPTVEIETVEDFVADGAAAPDERLIRVENLRALRAAMESLPERQRTAIVLCHFQGLAQAEAAAVLDVSEDAYESLLARGRRRLRAILAEKG